MFLKASAIVERVLLSKLLLIKTFQVFWANKSKLWRRKWILLSEVEIKVKKEVCENRPDGETRSVFCAVCQGWHSAILLHIRLNYVRL